MRQLLIFGFPKGTTVEEIREALEAAGVPVARVQIEPGTHQGADVALVGVDTDATGIRVLAQRLNGLVWKGHRLEAEYTLLFD